MALIVKFLSVFICTIYIFRTLTKHSTPFSASKLVNLIIVLCLTSLAFVLHSIYIEFTYIIPILVFWLFTSLLTHHPQQCFIGSIVSFTISFSQHILISLVFTFILFPLFSNLNTFPFTLLAILSSILQIYLCYLLCNTKRFKKGLLLISNQSYINIATVVCTLWSYIFTLILSNYLHSTNQLIWIFICIVSLAFLIYWWQAQITKAYRRSLELRELESMRTEMTELKLLLLELTEENERLARITHRDNTLISALKNATLKYLSTDYANPAAAMEVRNQLIENINSLSAERVRMVDTHKENLARTFDTGISLLDELLREMDEKAQEMNVIFAVHMGTSLENFIPKDISESDLVHTVDDLLKNAFKATASCEKRIVQLQFYKLGKHLVIEVADNGIPFEVKSLVNIGIEKLTTYEDGSGIGLMDIWSTKGKYGATYHLEEYADATPFSKKISLTLDKKNRYSIRTSRKDEILQASRRADLQVYDFSE